MWHHEHFSPPLVTIPGTCWSCRGVWFLARDRALSHAVSMGKLGCSPARREWCRAPGSAETSQVWSGCRFSLPSGKICTIPHPPPPPPQNPTFCHLYFFITTMLMNSWQISDSCFHSFTFADGNILAYLKKRSWRWTLSENLAQKSYAFHLTSPVLFAGGRLEIILNLGHSLAVLKLLGCVPFMFCIWLEHCRILLSHEALSFLLKWDFEIRY